MGLLVINLISTLGVNPKKLIKLIKFGKNFLSNFSLIIFKRLLLPDQL